MPGTGDWLREWVKDPGAEDNVCTSEFLKSEEDQVLFRPGRWEVGGGKVVPTGELEPDALDGEMIAVPHNAQFTCVLHAWPGMLEGFSSCSSAMVGMGSIDSSPLWIAEMTDLLESQFKEGAKSSRTVGSLYVEKVSTLDRQI